MVRFKHKKKNSKYYFMKMSGDKMLASSSMLMFLLSLLMASFFDTTAGQIGVCFGQMGNNLPNPREVVAMYQYYNIKRMRMYGNNTEALDALRGSGIEFILDVPNPYLKRFAESQREAHAWVQNYVKNYSKDIIFRYISVGNEVKPGAEGRVLFQAMQNIDKAVSEAGLSHIKVSTTTYMGAFADTFPPSHGRFKDEFRSFLQPAIHFLAKKGSPLLVNIYTYFAYKDNKDKIPLEYALFTQTTGGNPDKQYIYRNLFDASLDSVYAALEKTGGGSMDIVVSESGWPTHGDEPEANVDNAKIYINNLIQHVKKGSPKKTGKPIETYIFAMFDEDLKGPQKYEKYWGLFFPTKQPKYEVEFD